ncbi:MAG: winged helix-turn-helix transcriptional regulator [Candidatus Pacearchaeota archaeon]
MELFNVWNLEKVNIKLRTNFTKKINNIISLKFKTKNDAYNKIIYDKNIPFITFKNLLKESYTKEFFVPLEIFLKICLSLNISKEELQKNIVSYKTAGGVNFIEEPKLPIIITPVFDMLLAHHFGDGTVINPKNNRIPYFGYRQFNDFYRSAYVHKLENVFGKIKYKKDYFLLSTRPYCPPVLSTLFFKYYNLSINDFLSERARLPSIILNKGKDSLLAFLVAFIIDEGNIDSTQISIKLKNKLLIEDLNKICNILGYKSKIINSKEADYFGVYILREGMNKLYKDYLILNKKYPIINLGIKGERIKSSFEIFNRPISRISGNNNLILEILKNEELSVNQIADRINMTRQGVRYHIHKLIKDNKIKIIDNTNLNWIYGIKKC